MSRLAALPRWLVWPVAAAVGVTFVVASLDKIANPGDFAQSVYYYRLAPAALLHAFALVLPWTELLAGLALILGPLRRGAALLVALMCLLFIVAIAAALARDLDISCGCFGTGGGHGVGLELIVRDVLLLAGALLVLIQRR